MDYAVNAETRVLAHANCNGRQHQPLKQLLCARHALPGLTTQPARNLAQPPQYPRLPQAFVRGPVPGQLLSNLENQRQRELVRVCVHVTSVSTDLPAAMRWLVGT